MAAPCCAALDTPQGSPHPRAGPPAAVETDPTPRALGSWGSSHSAQEQCSETTVQVEDWPWRVNGPRRTLVWWVSRNPRSGGVWSGGGGERKQAPPVPEVGGRERGGRHACGWVSLLLHSASQAEKSVPGPGRGLRLPRPGSGPLWERKPAPPPASPGLGAAMGESLGPGPAARLLSEP